MSIDFVSLDDIEKTNTKFLIITHHALTMSRMDRLFGATMAERGVSQIVSVDLKKLKRLEPLPSILKMNNDANSLENE